MIFLAAALICGQAEAGNLSYATQCMKKWCAYYSIPENLMIAIIQYESRWVQSATGDDYNVLQYYSWALDVVRKFGLDPMNRTNYFSCGRTQINYLVALSLGFRGSVAQLYQDDENFHYACKRLWQIRLDHELRDDYFCVENWIYHYNTGPTYIRNVLKKYRQLQGVRR